ncbi:hypothetical protein [Tepidibacter hydrothermalis]|uniref:Uncharacterized protein n=1 Tax=Tepidibacter hydrothermalis TaxID=3036126 RepID=A0ABY8EH08_9FIRM|nr:hypothetical protein [Tepidibacter hydrothermalis]WFD12046.1 hypothetical protein P4S50_08195 [Tepidibacter hydrothermalis]
MSKVIDFNLAKKKIKHKQQSKNNYFKKIKFQNNKVLLMVFMVILSIVGLFSLLTPLRQPNKAVDIEMNSSSIVNYNSNSNLMHNYIS